MYDNTTRNQVSSSRMWICFVRNDKFWKIAFKSRILFSIWSILQISQEVCNRVAVMLEECSGLDYIEKLQEHENHRIYTKSAQVGNLFNLCYITSPPLFTEHLICNVFVDNKSTFFIIQKVL